MKWYFEALKKYVDFSGRARRKEYWLFFLWNLVIQVALVLLIAPLVTVYGLLVFLPSIAVVVRRLHDTNHKGWWLLLPPIFIITLVFLCRKGTDGGNNYGPDPLAAEALDAGSRPQTILNPSTEAPATKVVQQGSMADELKKLSELKDSGILTEAEFEEQKAKLLETD